MSSTGAGTGEQLSLVRASTRATAARPGPGPGRGRPRRRRRGRRRAGPPRPPVRVRRARGAGRRRPCPGRGCKVRFAGQDVDGFVVERRAEAEHEGRLAPLRRVVSPEPVLTPALLAALPGRRRALRRHARRRAAAGDPPAARDRGEEPRRSSRRPEPPPMPGAGPLGALPGRAVVPAPDRLRAGAGSLVAGAPRPAPAGGRRRCGAGARPDGDPDPGRVALASLPPAPAGRIAGHADGRRTGRRDRPPPAAGPVPSRAAATPPTGRPRSRWPPAPRWPPGAAPCSSCPTTATSTGSTPPSRRSSGTGRHVRLTAGQGPQARYTAWLKVLRGHVRCVVGTRAAAFAPVHDLGPRRLVGRR